MIDGGKIDALAINALTEELDTYPKYGLVCPNTSGSHTDMDYSVMKAGIRSLMGCFGRFFEVGKSGINPQDALPILRKEGVEFEKKMLSATNEVNTHKGALFCLGLASFAVGVTADEFSLQKVSYVISKTCQGLTQELKTATGYGRRVFDRYGETGARGMAEDGYAVVVKKYVPLLKKLYKKYDDNEARSRLLACMASEIADVNILHRSDMETLLRAQQICGRLYRRYDRKRAEKANEWFVSRNVSAGGCADILSLTVFLHDAERLFAAEKTNKKGVVPSQ